MTYTIRNVDEKTKESLSRYASSHGMTMGEAMQQLIESGLEYQRQHGNSARKYSGVREAMDALPKW